MARIPTGNGSWMFYNEPLDNTVAVQFSMTQQEIMMHGSDVLKMAMENIAHKIADYVMQDIGQAGLEEILDILEDRRALAVEALADACTDRGKVRCHRCAAMQRQQNHAQASMSGQPFTWPPVRNWQPPVKTNVP